MFFESFKVTLNFNPKHRVEKVTRNIGKNTSIIISAQDVPQFKLSKDFGLDKYRDENTLKLQNFFLFMFS